MRNLVWFRNDLRVYDNPALDAACNANNEVVAVYIVSESQWDEHNDSVNKISFWFRCLVELEKELKKMKEKEMKKLLRLLKIKIREYFHSMIRLFINLEH
jgi:deoxyribodipyrimidine photolyase